jgi:hypothetical protein
MLLSVSATPVEEETDTIREAMRILGSRRSEAKARAARENAKKAGRPKGTPQSDETRAKISATKKRKRREPAS